METIECRCCLSIVRDISRRAPGSRHVTRRGLLLIGVFVEDGGSSWGRWDGMRFGRVASLSRPAGGAWCVEFGRLAPAAAAENPKIP